MRLIAFRRQLAVVNAFNVERGYTKCDVCGNGVDALATCDGCRCVTWCGDAGCADGKTCTAATPSAVFTALTGIR